MKNILYGDGIHDDLPAIQEMLDTGMKLVYLPSPQKHYVISGAICVHSNQELKLDRYTRIRLANQANCAMLKNMDALQWNENITITGGIWDMNHENQNPNPGHFPDPETGLLLAQYLEINKFDKWGGVMHDAYTGTCFVFNRVKSLHIGNLTLENPVTYGMDLSYTEDFTVENIQFDYYEGSPKLWNMDGVHIDGGCKNGLIRNLHGACYDDTVAITSDDSLYGPIENITVDGIYAYNSHSAVRLLSARTPVKNIHITNIYGTYYAEAIIISKFIEAKERSAFENITISNVYASLSPGTVDVPGNKRPLIAIGNDMDLAGLSLSHIHRNETHCPNATIGLGENSKIGVLSVYCASQTNTTGKTMAFIENKGEIEKLYLTHVDSGGEPLLIGEGVARKIVQI